MSKPEIGVYLPHMGLSYEDVLRNRCSDETLELLAGEVIPALSLSG